MMDLAVPADLYFEPFRQRIDRGHTDPVQSA